MAASLALHLVGLAALSRIAPPPAPRERPFEVELVELAAPSGARAGAPARGAPAATPPRRPAWRAPARPRTEEGAPATSGPLPSASAAPAGPGPRLALDLDGEGLAIAPADRAVDLRARPRGGAPAGSPGGGGDVPARPATAADRWISDLAARARVASGLAHPYTGELARAFSSAWDAERALKARGVSGYLAQVGDNLRTFARVWSRVAEQFGRNDPGFLEGNSDRIRELAGVPAGPAQDALLEADVDRQLRALGSEGHVATVRVVQAPDGALRSVELISPSRDAEVDREALTAVRSAVARLPAPPPEALVGQDAFVTTWEFEIEVSISPPLPTVSLVFDEVRGLRDLRLPLDRRIWKKVRLVGVG